MRKVRNLRKLRNFEKSEKILRISEKSEKKNLNIFLRCTLSSSGQPLEWDISVARWRGSSISEYYSNVFISSKGKKIPVNKTEEIKKKGLGLTGQEPVSFKSFLSLESSAQVTRNVMNDHSFL